MIRMLGLTDDKEIFCICIRTRGGIYGEIWPGTPEGSGHILPYIPSRVLIRTLYHF